MTMFNSYVKLSEGKPTKNVVFFRVDLDEKVWFISLGHYENFLSGIAIGEWRMIEAINGPVKK